MESCRQLNQFFAVEAGLQMSSKGNESGIKIHQVIHGLAYVSVVDMSASLSSWKIQFEVLHVAIEGRLVEKESQLRDSLSCVG